MYTFRNFFTLIGKSEIQEGFTKITLASTGRPSAGWKVAQIMVSYEVMIQYLSFWVLQGISLLFILVSESS